MKRLLFCLAFVLTPLAMAQTAEEIMDKAAATLGDTKKIESITSMTVNGRIVMPQGIEGKINIMNKQPNMVKVVMDMKAPGMDLQMIQGCDGTDCYANDPMTGLRKLEGQEKEAMMMQNDMRSSIKWRDHYQNVKLEGSETLDDTEVFVVSMETKEGMPLKNFYRKSDYYLQKSEMVNKGPMGEMKVDVFYEDYKTFQEIITIPATMRMVMMNGVEMKMFFEDLDVTTPLPDSMFKLPPGLE